MVMIATKLIALLTITAFLFAPVSAKADVDGAVPGPGLCQYPGIGGSGAAFGEFDYSCAFPTEVNGSHWQCLYGGAMSFGTVGVGILMFNASITTPVGVLRGACWWACPSLEQAEAPNPPGGWKYHIEPPACKPTGPNPLLPPEKPSPEVVTPDQGNSSGLTPAVTDPAQGNPGATTNPQN
jgi:hypothetical protein